MKTNLFHRSIPLCGGGLIFAGGWAQAQTFFYTNAGSGSQAAAGAVALNGSLADIGLDLRLFQHVDNSVAADTGGVATRPNSGFVAPPYDIDVVAPSLASLAPPGTELQTVTFYFYAEEVSPDGAPMDFSLYDKVGASTGPRIGTLTLSGPGDEGKFFSFSLTADQFAGGFSITSEGLGNTTQLNVSSELNTEESGFRVPGVSATFAPVPEPSGGLLAGLACLGLLRRRRKPQKPGAKGVSGSAV